MPGEGFPLLACRRNSGVQFKVIREQRTQAWYNSSASSTHGVLSTRFAEEPNTFVGWEVEPELAPGGVGVGTSLGNGGHLNSIEAYCPSYSGHLRAGDVVAS